MFCEIVFTPVLPVVKKPLRTTPLAVVELPTMLRTKLPVALTLDAPIWIAYIETVPTILSLMEPAAEPPITLLFTVWVTPVVEPTRMPLNPVTVPVPPLLIVIDPMLLLLTLTFPTKLKSRIPWTGDVLVVVELSLTTIVDEPSRLPIVFPDMLAGASVEPEPL